MDELRRLVESFRVGPEEKESAEHLEFQLTSSHEEDRLVPAFRPELHDKYSNGPNYAKVTGWQNCALWLYLMGRTRAGRSVCVAMHVWQCVVFEPPAGREEDLEARVCSLLQPARSDVVFEVQRRHRLFACELDQADPAQLATYPFVVVRCASAMRAKAVSKRLVGEGFSVVEQGVSAFTRFAHGCGLKPSSIVRVPLAVLVDRTSNAQRMSHCDLEYVYELGAGRAAFEQVCDLQSYPLRVVFVDIESPTVVGDDVAESAIPFCDAQKDPIVTVCCSVMDSRTARSASVSFSCWAHDPVEVEKDAGDHVQLWFDNELAMLEAFRDFVIAVDADAVSGWNLFRFDYRYMYDRVRLLDARSRFFFWSRLIRSECVRKDRVWSSKQRGDIETSEYQVPGRLMLDLMLHWMANYKLHSYALGAVAAQELPPEKRKIEYGHKQMGCDARSGDPKRRRRVVEYCVRDAQVVEYLLVKTGVLEHLTQMSMATCTTMQDLHIHGQTRQTINMIFCVANEMGFIMTHTKMTTDESVKYKGGEVFEVEPGYYTAPVMTVDYASMYPSIIAQYNICFSTLLSESKSEPGSYECMTDIGRFEFRQDKPGVLPTVVAKLLDARKATKKQLALTTDPNLRRSLDIRQRCLKIAANSIYGFAATLTNKQYYMPAIAATIATTGRLTILATRERLVELLKEYKVRAISGDTDSLMILFPTLTRDDIPSLFVIGRRAAAQASRGHLVLDVEKISVQYLVFGKKKYAALVYMDPDSEPVVLSKGGVDVSRSHAIFISQFYAHLIDALLLSRITTPDALLAEIKQLLERLVAGNLPLQELATSMKVSTYKTDEDVLMQQVVMSKIQARKGARPKAGDRISYVITHVPGKKAIRDKVEDLHFLLENPSAARIDYLYYIDSLYGQLRPLFALRFGDARPLDVLVGSVRGAQERALNKGRSLLDATFLQRIASAPKRPNPTIVKVFESLPAPPPRTHKFPAHYYEPLPLFPLYKDTPAVSLSRVDDFPLADNPAKRPKS